MKANESASSPIPSNPLKNRGIICRKKLPPLLGVILAGLALTQIVRAQPAAAQPTFKLGDVPVSVKGSFETEFNDNINYSNHNRSSDIILRPGVILAINYKLTDINTVALQMGLSYDEYLIHRNLSSYSNFAEVSPDSQLALSIKPRDTITLTVYDSFNYSVQPNDALAVNPNTGQVITNIRALGRFMNQIGVKGEWAATTDTTFNAGFYRYDVIPQDSTYDFLRRWQYTAQAGVRRLLDPFILSVDASYTKNYYQTDLQNDSASWYIGPTLTWTMEGLVVKATVGFNDYSFQHNGTNGDTSQPSTYTGELSATNTLTNAISHTLTLTRSSSFGYVSNTVQIDRVSYKVDYKEFLLKAMTGTLLAYYEWGGDSGGNTPEHYGKYAISPSVEYLVRPGFTVYASYEFAQKSSNFGDRNYTRNQFIVGLRYDF